MIFSLFGITHLAIIWFVYKIDRSELLSDPQGSFWRGPWPPVSQNGSHFFLAGGRYGPHFLEQAPKYFGRGPSRNFLYIFLRFFFKFSVFYYFAIFCTFKLIKASYNVLSQCRAPQRELSKLDFTGNSCDYTPCAHSRLRAGLQLSKCHHNVTQKSDQF